MIHVDRNRVPMPEILGPDANAKGARELEKAREFYQAPLEERQQRRFAFTAYRDRSVVTALEELFYGKCAYCESKMTATGPVDVDHFRPKGGVVGEAGQSYPDLYWWLANEWTNLYPACANCNRLLKHDTVTSKGSEPVLSGKGGRFPLEDEGQRAAQPGEERSEKPLLLDPCVDHPEEHLVFTETGLLVSETLRGQTTIAVMGLNRASLVDARRDTVRQVAAQIDAVQRLLQRIEMETPDGERWWEVNEWLEKESNELMQLAEPDQEYAALKRQLVHSFIQDWDAELVAEPQELAWQFPDLKVTEEEQEQAKESYMEYQRSLEDYSLEEEGGEKQYLSQRRLIERIEISNLKALTDVELDLTRSEGGATPWMMLLGENGTGKSTILQAVALALLGEKYFTRLVSKLGIHPAGFVRRGCETGHVKVYLSGFSRPFVLTFRENAVEFDGSRGETSRVGFADDGTIRGDDGGWRAKVFVLGYGATRLLPRGMEHESYGERYARVDSLFSPFTPLVDASRWLLALPDDRFLLTRWALKDLLGLEEEDDIFPRGDRIWVKAHGTEVPLEYLSDGYQSVVALTADILEIVLSLWPEPDAAEGIVLLDEIGAHLHPTWKIRIVSSMRGFMPRMQFVVASHEPLCLRGLYDGEVVVMRRDTEQVVRTVTDLPSVQTLRVDQLLTSEHFGLLSTRSLHIEEQFAEYYGLLAKRTLTAKEEERLEDLKRELDEQREMGTTRRERIMLEAIDRYLATEPDFLGTPQANQRRDEVDQELDGILED